jgi:predicted secreted hydrolase
LTLRAAALLLIALLLAPAAQPAEPAAVVPGYQIRFPQDEGSHPQFRLEWWYVTGWLDLPDRSPAGFQVTFFRVLSDKAHADNPSRFNPRQILFAHAALSDPKIGKLLHGEKLARAGFGVAEAQAGNTSVWIDDWSLRQEGNRYSARVRTADFAFELRFERTQAPLLQGEQGLSRKGPRAQSASYYYSFAHMKVSGTLLRDAKPVSVTGTAWLDHEWSSSYLDERAVGWDWIGINFDDGGALMAFRMREKSGNPFWSAATLRMASGSITTFRPEQVTFTALREWRSPLTNVAYPVSFHVQVGELGLELAPLMDDQELDSRQSTQAIYWEGAVRALRSGKQIGKGYLELTGYPEALRLTQ